VDPVSSPTTGLDTPRYHLNAYPFEKVVVVNANLLDESRDRIPSVEETHPLIDWAILVTVSTTVGRLSKCG